MNRRGGTRPGGIDGHRDDRGKATPAGGRIPSTPSPVPLPELAALGVGTLVAAAVARRARRARHVASLARSEGQPASTVSEAAADTAALLIPFEGAPVLDLLEVAIRHLTGVLAGAGRRGEVPPVRLVRVGPDGVEIRFRSPVRWAPACWNLRDERAWHLPAGLDPEVLADGAGGRQPWLPTLVPVGENDDGAWLLPVERGCCLPVVGPAAAALAAAMRVAVESWGWAGELVITSDASTAERAASGGDGLASGPDDPFRPPVVYFGDPASISEAARARCGVVTTLPVAATDLTVLVDSRAASLHPVGVTVRPNLLDDDRELAVADLVGVPEPLPSVEGAQSVVLRPSASPSAPDQGAATATDAPGVASGSPARSRPPAPAAVRNGPVAPTEDPWALGPGPVEVRLLTAVPRIDGLVEELPAKRARRATELVAYLALHHPDPVTSDRLRTRVLGSADADAAAKTLFNTAGAGRRALGRDRFDEPLLPPASRSGHYRVSPLVTVDVTRAAALVAAATSVADPEEAMALLRAALDLVEGEPLAGILTGYAWWGAEGHERRIASTLVDGACRLARLAAPAGYLDLARWGLEQARLVEPYSEVLSRAAMQVAAEAGDADRLRREWVECQQRVEELDPGTLPSEATERLYADLRRRVPSYASGESGG